MCGLHNEHAVKTGMYSNISGKTNCNLVVGIYHHASNITCIVLQSVTVKIHHLLIEDYIIKCHHAVSPDSATSDTWMFCLWAIKPRIEKMTKPARKLVKVLIPANQRLSLQRKTLHFFLTAWSEKVFTQRKDERKMFRKKNLGYLLGYRWHVEHCVRESID